MNRKHILILLLALAGASLQTLRAQNFRAATYYMVGYAQSFKDSTVYLAPPVEVSNVPTERRTGYVYLRSVYSSQFESFIEKTYGQRYQTGAVFIASSLKAAQKKYASLKRRIERSDEFKLTEIPEGRFSFKAVPMAEVEKQQDRTHTDAVKED